MTERMKGYLAELARIGANLKIEESDDEEISENCEHCNNTGMYKYEGLPQGHRLYEKPVPCEYCKKGAEIYHDILRRSIDHSALPKIYHDANLDNWLLGIRKAKGKLMAYAIALEFIQNQDHRVSSHKAVARFKTLKKHNIPESILNVLRIPEKNYIGFVFYGPVGTGKTWLAAAAMNELLKQGEIVMYMRAQDIIQSLTDTWNKRNQDNDETTQEMLLRQYKSVPFLFIDDMNLETRHGDLLPHQKDYMENIIRHRSNNQLHTFITCNVNQEQFYHQWGQRTADVIANDLFWVKVGGTKLRYIQEPLDEGDE